MSVVVHDILFITIYIDNRPSQKVLCDYFQIVKLILLNPGISPSPHYQLNQFHLSEVR